MPPGLSLRRPSDADLRAVAATRGGAPLSVAPGSTDGPVPAGMVLNRGGGRIGAGADAFAAARAALFALRMFDLGWMRAASTGPVAAGTDVATAARLFGLWWIDVCRVVRIVDEPGRAGFVYATVQGHRMVGEERFLVELHGDAVVFGLLAHAAAAAPLSRFGWPLVRAMQRRFAREATAVMARAVTTAEHGP